MACDVSPVAMFISGGYLRTVVTDTNISHANIDLAELVKCLSALTETLKMQKTIVFRRKGTVLVGECRDTDTDIEADTNVDFCSADR